MTCTFFARAILSMCVVGRSRFEACRAGAGVHGAFPPRLGGHRSPGDRLWWHRVGGPRHGDGRVDHPARAARSRRCVTPAAVAQPARGGRSKRATVTDPTLLRDLDALVEPTAPGDPDSPLRWTSRSVRTLAVALDGLGHHVSHTVVAELLHALGYSLQGNVKTREGRQHPDRDAQFRYIAQVVRRWQRRRQPTISVDTKKKELVGDFKNGGRDWRPGEDAPAGPRPRFRDPPTATQGGKAFRTASTICTRWRLGERGHRSRHGELRGPGDPSLVAGHGTARVPSRSVAADHRGCRREQRRPPPALEMGTAAAGESHGAHHHGVPLSAGHEQVEQDRASPVLTHRHELAGDTARRPGHDRQSHRVHPQPVGLRVPFPIPLPPYSSEIIVTALRKTIVLIFS